MFSRTQPSPSGPKKGQTQAKLAFMPIRKQASSSSGSSSTTKGLAAAPAASNPAAPAQLNSRPRNEPGPTAVQTTMGALRRPTVMPSVVPTIQYSVSQTPSSLADHDGFGEPSRPAPEAAAGGLSRTTSMAMSSSSFVDLTYESTDDFDFDDPVFAEMDQFGLGGSFGKGPAQPAPRPAVKKKRKLPWAVPEETPATQARPFPAPPSEKIAPERPPVIYPSLEHEKNRATATKVAATRVPSGSFKDTPLPKPPAQPQKAPESGAADEIKLSEEQEYIVDMVVNGKKSIFFTGAAGTGKSVLLRELIRQLKKKYRYEREAVAVTASTGLAACNIGGTTLHRYSGVGLGKEPVSTLVTRVEKTKRSRDRWRSTKVLIVDEVSMVDGDLFDKLEEIARQIRKTPRPFGGIQLVITGDFFQLPPVPDQFNGKKPTFAFDAKSWAAAVPHTICLHQVFRQKDPVFATMLNEMREGRLSPDSISNFKMLTRPLAVQGAVQATELFATRNEVNNANNVRMRNLRGQERHFRAEDGGALQDMTQRKRLLDNVLAPELLVLKEGAQVMLVKNLDARFVNGRVGTVRAFMTITEWNTGCVNGFPAEYDDVIGHEIRFDFESGMGGMQGGMGSTSINGMFSGSSSLLHQSLPVVRFPDSDGYDDIICLPEEWKVEMPDGEIQAYRVQVPLMLAWALSIHKAQGQTLEFVRVDLGRAFETGQAYVALSRATSMQGLQVVGFHPSKVMVHERVREFYTGLSKAGSIRAKQLENVDDDVEASRTKKKRRF